MAQTVAATDPAAGIAAVVAVVPEAGTVAAVAGTAVPGAGSPGTSVAQHVGTVGNLLPVKSFAEAGIAVEECSGTGVEEGRPDLTVEVWPPSAALVAHLQNQTLAAAAVAAAVAAAAVAAAVGQK